MATVEVPQGMTELPKFEFAPAFLPLFWKGYRYKIFWGGRGAGKSWAVARALIHLAMQERCRIACLRELQNSIKDSVHQLIREQIFLMGLTKYFEVTDKVIRCLPTGSDFIFKGLRSNVTEIKSTEGIKYAWVEEAQLVSKDSWEILTPTIRTENSEIWVTFNPIEEEDPTYQRFIAHLPHGSVRVKVGWQDNPFFTQALERERQSLLQTDPDAYAHVWEGSCRVMSEAVIFRGRYVIEAFETPTNPPPDRFFHGLDFGFANDPNAFLRSYITTEPATKAVINGVTKDIRAGEHLWIDRESFGWGVEINELPEMLDKIPTARRWPIKADCARPETISYLCNQGFNVEAAEKWTGCVEDGIAHFKGFALIHLHAECKHTQDEFRLYSYKRDRVTSEVLPKIIDKNNHGVDAERYALDGYIQRRGIDGVWAKL